jgi:MYXO-CTERM domain-containing protein
MKAKLLGFAAAAALASFGAMPKADACGCFAPPDPSVPIVQAGERILFAMNNGQVTAHVQISYQGSASDFGWLLPLPSVPTLELGVDELFNQLVSSTQPKYKLNRVYEGNCSFNPARFGGGGGLAAAPSNGAGGGDSSQTGSSPLVIQDSIGPYDYAVLKADSKDAMLQWLNTNHYFIPTGTDSAVDPYIHPGAYFLALKLKSGNSTGDLQPVVIKYQSDLPMIPLVLTSVGAKPDMGIQVWMLGQGRAIPRNYYHTVINDAVLDWNNGSQNYEDVIIRATKEAPARHTFVTEYAGAVTPMKGLLNAPGRFGSNAELAAQPDAVSFVQYLYSHNFGTLNQPQGGGGPVQSFGYQLSSQLISILQKYVPVPPALVQKGITAQFFYQDISYYLGQYQQMNPADFTGWTLNYQPTMMAQEIDARVVQPTLAAGALFDNYPYLTRLYTTLSPENMDKDPVFSFNVGLPDWNNEHDGTLTYHCGVIGNSNQTNTSATLQTAEGWTINYPYGTGTTFTAPNLPASLRIEILAEEGNPQVVTDNSGQIKSGIGGSSGCSYGGSSSDTGWWMLGGLLLVAGTLIRRREQF